ncbi:glycosyltransferase family 4 protein [Georgenia yuyongxinii]|uniref:Glycosyltransferase family 4 protein n=1 Tax=Georgenia yuyongxinii TaxID=2589797 RepID=A0A5B8BYP3_9MICO|nr:glycosyltransferase family 4 protein [Georgenia yuyongxinii]QDC23529.1 glycosyltransferase family 4 protein [Georgenia yuyongxinii]
MTRLALVTWTAREPSGGNTFNRELVDALRAGGADVTIRAVPGEWPTAAPADRAVLAAELAAARARDETVLVDAIVACGAPAEVGAAVAAGTTVAVLLHMLPSDVAGLAVAERQRRAAAEAAALRAASVVICPSSAAAEDLVRRYGVRAHVAAPGTRPVPPAAGTRPPAPPAVGTRPPAPPELMALANLVPGKDQVTLVRALAQVRDLAWTARLVGATGVDPAYTAVVRGEIAAAGLTDRVTLTGAKVGAALEAEWARTDLLVLSSRSETFGLVVLEALAHGVPAVVPAGTGAVEALASGSVGAGGLSGRAPDGAVPPGRAVATDPAEPPGRAVPPGDPDALAATFREWLTSPPLRDAWAAAARERRGRLPGWDVTAAQVLAALAQPM